MEPQKALGRVLWFKKMCNTCVFSQPAALLPPAPGKLSMSGTKIQLGGSHLFKLLDLRLLKHGEDV